MNMQWRRANIEIAENRDRESRTNSVWVGREGENVPNGKMNSILEHSVIFWEDAQQSRYSTYQKRNRWEAKLQNLQRKQTLVENDMQRRENSKSWKACWIVVAVCVRRLRCRLAGDDDGALQQQQQKRWICLTKDC
jgi:hypothetical protein